ncbi:MAG: hypothetical protein ACOCRZ_05615 [Halothermotrichaceae bacterium]
MFKKIYKFTFILFFVLFLFFISSISYSINIETASINYSYYNYDYSSELYISSSNKYEAVRRLETYPGYNMARQIIQLPSESDLKIPEGRNSAWNYCGVNNNYGINCEFGVGYQADFDKWLLFAVTPDYGWNYIENGSITFNPGEIITLTLIVLDNNIRCIVHDQQDNIVWDEIIPATGLSRSCYNGERVRLMTTLVLNNGFEIYSHNNRRFDAVISDGKTEQHFDGSQGIQTTETKYKGKSSEWVKIQSFQPYYDENINLEISFNKL